MIKKNLKIFIADKDDYRANVYRNLLESSGFYQVFNMADTATCINSLVISPDLILIDYSFDNYSGLKLLKKIKRINPDVHVVIISEIEELNSAIEALNSGAYDIILKSGIEEEHLKMILENISAMKEIKSRRNFGILNKVASLFW